MIAMTERRKRRSGLEGEALRLLLAAVKERSEITSIALIDSRGLVISGMGTSRELAILGAIAQPVAGGKVTAACERLTVGTDVIAKAVRSPRGTMYLAALGDRVGRLTDATQGIERILRRVA
jgi:hypothetical protein